MSDHVFAKWFPVLANRGRKLDKQIDAATSTEQPADAPAPAPTRTMSQYEFASGGPRQRELDRQKRLAEALRKKE